MAFKPFGISHLGIHPNGNTERNHNKRRLIPCRRLLIHSLPTGDSEEPTMLGGVRFDALRSCNGCWYRQSPYGGFQDVEGMLIGIQLHSAIQG